MCVCICYVSVCVCARVCVCMRGMCLCVSVCVCVQRMVCVRAVPPATPLLNTPVYATCVTLILQVISGTRACAEARLAGYSRKFV